MKHTGLVILFLPFLLIPAVTCGTDTLQVNDAIALALENNFSISLAEDDYRIAGINNSMGNAGMLPRVDVTAARSRSVNNQRQEYFDGRLREGKNAASDTKTAGVQLSWTVFDGLGMFIRREKLNELEKLSAIQLRSVIENTVSRIIGTYYEIVSQTKLSVVFHDALRISAERKSMAGTKYKLGGGSELALLQATVDMNADSANLIRQNALIENLKAELNGLLCRNLDTPFEVSDHIPVNRTMDYQELVSKANLENPGLQEARNAITLAMLAIKELKSNQIPTINFTSGYNYNQSQSEVGLLISNRNYGYSLGLSLSYNIFNGFTNKQKISTAKISEEASQTEYRNVEQEILTNLKKVFNDYRTNLWLVGFETENLGFAEHNFAIAKEKYRLGSLNDIEFRETQYKLITAENRLLSAFFSCKLAETELLRLTGQLSADLPDK